MKQISCLRVRKQSRTTLPQQYTSPNSFGVESARFDQGAHWKVHVGGGMVSSGSLKGGAGRSDGRRVGARVRAQSASGHEPARAVGRASGLARARLRAADGQSAVGARAGGPPRVPGACHGHERVSPPNFHSGTLSLRQRGKAHVARAHSAPRLPCSHRDPLCSGGLRRESKRAGCGAGGCLRGAPLLVSAKFKCLRSPELGRWTAASSAGNPCDVHVFAHNDH